METEHKQMSPEELANLSTYLKSCFDAGETDQEIVEDIFGSGGVWREDLIALIRSMVKKQ